MPTQEQILRKILSYTAKNLNEVLNSHIYPKSFIDFYTDSPINDIDIDLNLNINAEREHNEFEKVVDCLDYIGRNIDQVREYSSNININSSFNKIIKTLRSEETMTNIHEEILSRLLGAIAKLDDSNEIEQSKKINTYFKLLDVITGDKLYDRLDDPHVANNLKNDIDDLVEKNEKLLKAINKLNELCEKEPHRFEKLKENPYTRYYLSAPVDIEINKAMRQKKQDVQAKAKEDLGVFLDSVKDVKITDFEDYYGKEDKKVFLNEDDENKIKFFVDNMLETYNNARSAGFTGEDAYRVETIFGELKSHNQMTPIHNYLRNSLMEELADPNKALSENHLKKLYDYDTILTQITGKELKKSLKEKYEKKEMQRSMMDSMSEDNNQIFDSIQWIVQGSENKNKLVSDMCRPMLKSPYISGYVETVKHLIQPDIITSEYDKEVHEIKEKFFEKKIDSEYQKMNESIARYDEISAQKSLEIDKRRECQEIIDIYKGRIKTQEYLCSTMIEKGRIAEEAINTLTYTLSADDGSGKFLNIFKSFDTLGKVNADNEKESFVDTLKQTIDFKKENYKIEDLCAYKETVTKVVDAVDEYIKIKGKKLNRLFGTGRTRYKAALELRSNLFEIQYSFNGLMDFNNGISAEDYSNYCTAIEYKSKFDDLLVDDQKELDKNRASIGKHEKRMNNYKKIKEGLTPIENTSKLDTLLKKPVSKASTITRSTALGKK